MIEKRLDKMENMIAQLIQMVGNMNEKMDSRFQAMEDSNKVRHVELVDQIKQLEMKER
jgi:hypothetical protein